MTVFKLHVYPKVPELPLSPPDHLPLPPPHPYPIPPVLISQILQQL